MRELEERLAALEKRVTELETKNPTKRRISRSKGEPTDAAKIRTQFLACYRKFYGRDYPGWGVKENALATSWLKSCPLDKALVLCEFFPKWRDPYAVRRAHAFPELTKRWIEFDAWVQDSEGHAFRIAEARVTEKLSLQKAEDVIHVERSARQATRPLELSGRLRPQLSSETVERFSGPSSKSFGSDDENF